MRDEWNNSTLVLLGHGSTKNEGSSGPVYQHAATLRARNLFAEVREAFWKQEPKVADVLATTAAARVFIVPLFISDGYFTEEAIPVALGFKRPGEVDWARVQQAGGRTLLFARPVGSHASMTAVLLARAREVVELHPFPRKAKPAETSLWIAGHGTPRNAESRKAIERQVELIRAQDLYAEVHPCFLEEEPLIAEVPVNAKARNIVVVPFFISDGLHAVEDIPMLLGEPEATVGKRMAAGQPTWRNPTEKHGKRIWYAPAVGGDPGMADVILERVRESLAEAPETGAVEIGD